MTWKALKDQPSNEQRRNREGSSNSATYYIDDQRLRQMAEAPFDIAVGSGCVQRQVITCMPAGRERGMVQQSFAGHPAHEEDGEVRLTGPGLSWGEARSNVGTSPVGGPTLIRLYHPPNSFHTCLYFDYWIPIRTYIKDLYGTGVKPSLLIDSLSNVLSATVSLASLCIFPWT